MAYMARTQEESLCPASPLRSLFVPRCWPPSQSWGRTGCCAAAPSYVDPIYGFSIQGPAFHRIDQGMVIPVTFIGPTENGISNTANVIVEVRTTTRRLPQAYLGATQGRRVHRDLRQGRDGRRQGRHPFELRGNRAGPRPPLARCGRHRHGPRFHGYLHLQQGRLPEGRKGVHGQH